MPKSTAWLRRALFFDLGEADDPLRLTVAAFRLLSRSCSENLAMFPSLWDALTRLWSFCFEEA